LTARRRRCNVSMSRRSACESFATNHPLTVLDSRGRVDDVRPYSSK
jgi:hypothetical protein